LANEVKEILDYHKSISHLRGGEATKLKYKKDEILEGEPVQQALCNHHGIYIFSEIVQFLHPQKFVKNLLCFQLFFCIFYDRYI
jgi:hypothetical protein